MSIYDTFGFAYQIFCVVACSAQILYFAARGLAGLKRDAEAGAHQAYLDWTKGQQARIQNEDEMRRMKEGLVRQ